MILSDILIIGSGVSGLSCAIKMAQLNPKISITLVTKQEAINSNTDYAQGGISVVLDETNDSFQRHLEDTLLAGDGLCDENIVKMVVEEGPKRFKEIISWGTKFDKNTEGEYDLGKEGGHTAHRVAHYKDITGHEIEESLLNKAYSYPNVNILPHHYAIDLITEHHIKDADLEDGVTCFGAYVLDDQSVMQTFLSKITILASGGAGQVYAYTTNPTVATGDGIGLASRAKVQIKHMQFYQFHPTALYGRTDPAFLISEAVRGFGAKLRTITGKKFLHKYDHREELASRDIVARAIDDELKVSGAPYVCLDCRHLDRKAFMEHFPNIYNSCLAVGIDCFQQMIPVVPAAHYMCGGVEINEWGESSMQHLLAIGEVSCSGLHGANRLASNSLLEGLVFGHRVAVRAIELLPMIDLSRWISKIPEWNQEGMKLPEEMVLINYLIRELRSLMSHLVGIVRSNERLDLAEKKVEEICHVVTELYNMSILNPKLAELRNLSSVAALIIKQSKEQQENRGSFYNKNLI